ncbi:MAG: hypothetical protein KAG66_18695 [Methylococcales bacterium]|nr:hypothetical protein [Methylococcales bacterium]
MTIASNNKYLHTLLSFTINGQAFNLVNDTEALNSQGVDYSPSAFKADLLPQPAKGMATTAINFSNVAADGEPSELGEITFDAIQSIMGELITIRRVFTDAPDTHLIELPLEVLTVSITPQTVSISAGYYNLYYQTLARDYYDATTAPGLVG